MADPFSQDVDPFAQDLEYTSRQESTLSGSSGIPTEEQQQGRRRRAESETRFGQLGGGRRVMAGLRQVASSAPLIRHIPPVRRFANPEEGTQEASDLSDYRLGSPGSARIGEFLGSALPYAVAGTALPRLFGNLPGAVAGNTAIGATDAKLDPHGNPLTAGIIDALGTAGAWGAGRILSPRSSPRAALAHAERDATTRQSADELIDAASDTQSSALNSALAELRGFSATTGMPIARGGTEAASRRIDAETPMIEQAGRDIASPPLRIPSIPNETSLRDMAFWGAIGTGAGHMMGNNPVMGGVAGVLLPEIRRYGINTANSAIDRLNRGFGNSAAGRRLNDIVFRYTNNQVLSDRDRAILHSLGGPGLAALTGASGTKRE